MSVEQIEQEVSKLERDQFARFSAWFEQFRADAWDKQITRDAEDGKFDAVLAEIDGELQRGEIRPL
jgi:ABC-type phosphate transport system auxiliary subunit